MRRPPGLTYAPVPAPGGPGRRRPAAWRNLRVHTKGAWAEPRPVLGRVARWGVGLLLAVLSLAVLGREPALREAVRQQLNALRNGNAAEAVPSGGSAAAPAVELTPLALVSDGGLFVLGTDGCLEPAGGAALAERVPIVTGVPVREVPDQMRVRLEAPVELDLVKRILSGTGAETVSEINLEDPRAIVLYTRDAVKVKFERGPELSRDLRRFAAIREDLHRRGETAAVIDLRYLQQAVVRTRARR